MSKLHVIKQLRLGKVGDVFYIAADSEYIWSHAYHAKGLRIKQRGMKATYLDPSDCTAKRITEVTITRIADPPLKRKKHTCSECGEVGHYRSTCKLLLQCAEKV